MGCVRQAQLIHGILSKVCSMIFSTTVLQPSPTSICESPVRITIVVSHAGGLVLLCQIFHLRASFRPNLPFANHFCKHGWMPSGLQSVLNCVPIHNTGENSTDAAAFVYFLARGNPALEKGGRGRKRSQLNAPEVTFAQRPFGACNVKLPYWN